MSAHCMCIVGQREAVRHRTLRCLPAPKCCYPFLRYPHSIELVFDGHLRTSSTVYDVFEQLAPRTLCSVQFFPLSISRKARGGKVSRHSLLLSLAFNSIAPEHHCPFSLLVSRQPGKHG